MLVSFILGCSLGEFPLIWEKTYLLCLASSCKGETFRSRCAYKGKMAVSVRHIQLRVLVLTLHLLVPALRKNRMLFLAGSGLVTD